MKQYVNLKEVMLTSPASDLVKSLSEVKTLEDFYELGENPTFIETYEGVECPPLFNTGNGSKIIIRTMDYRLAHGEETTYEIEIRRCLLKNVSFTPLFAKYEVDWRELLQYVHKHLGDDFYPHQIEVDIDIAIAENGNENLDLCFSVG